MTVCSCLKVVRGSGNVFRDLGREGLSVRKAQAMTRSDAGDFSRIRNVDLSRFTIDRLMLIVNRLGSRVDVAVKFRQKASARHVPAP